MSLVHSPLQRFSLFSFVSYTLIFLGILTLSIAEESVIYVLLSFILLPLSLVWVEHKKQFALSKWSANLLGITAIGYALFELFFLSGSFLVSLTHFLILIQLIKLFQSKTSTDYWHLYLISLIQILVASVISTELIFGVLFVCYMIVGTWALILLHWNQEVERKQGRSDKVSHLSLENGTWFTKSFLIHTAILTLCMCLFTSLFFLFIPRLGAGFFQREIKRGMAISGFSETVDLNDIGAILENPQVVMWVEVLDPLPQGSAVPFLWRGLAFDQYRDGRWYAVDLPKRWFAADQEGRILLSSTIPSAAHESQRLIQRFTLQHLDTQVIFGAYHPQSIDEGLSWVRKDEADAVFAPYPHTGGIKYQITSLLPVNPTRTPDFSLHPPRKRKENVERYLQLPPLDDRIPQLARQVTAGVSTPYEKAKRLEVYLKTRYRYSLTLTPPPAREDPVAYFLFQSRAGHCEYFATALAILLRTLGIPSRYVNGFAQGEWNEYGSYFLVRQSDAHSWVEAYFPDYGWLPFDATPSRPSSPPSEWSATLQIVPKYFDSLRMKWYAYIIGYNYRHQRQLVGEIGENVFEIGTLFGESFTNWKALFLLDPQPAKLLGKILSVFLLVGGLLWGIRFAFWKITGVQGWRKGEPRYREPVIAYYQALLRVLARHGYTKQPWTTPQEFAESLTKDQPILAPLLQNFTRIYYHARFGGEPLPRELLSHLHTLLQAIKRGFQR